MSLEIWIWLNADMRPAHHACFTTDQQNLDDSIRERHLILTQRHQLSDHGGRHRFSGRPW